MFLTKPRDFSRSFRRMNNLDTGIVGHPDNILLFAEPPEYTMNMKILENM